MDVKIRRWAAISLVVGAVGVSACGDGDGDGPTVETVSQDVCESEQRWVGGTSGSSLMQPGGNCIRCHADSSGGPEFLFAGTIYRSASAETQCFGVEGATVVVTGENGESVEMPTNEAGNFFVETEDAPELTAPYSAKVVYEGRERVMTEALYSNNCVDCHSGGGGGRIPPRMLIPAPE